MTSSLGAPTIPAVAARFSTTLDVAQWSLTAALVSAAVLTPLVGRLADRGGERTLMLAVLVVVIVGNVVAATSLSLGLLIVGRVLQGAGASLIPLALTAVRRRLQGSRQASAFALVSVAAAIGLGLGYPLTGLAISAQGLPLAFGAGALLAIIALVDVHRHVRVLPRLAPIALRRIDWWGFALFGTGMVATLVAISRGRVWGWTSAPTLVAAATGVVVLSLWSAHALKRDGPLIDIRLMRARPILVANLAAVLLGVPVYFLFTSVSVYIQGDPGSEVGLGDSAAIAGLAMAPMSLGSFVSAQLAHRLSGVLPTMLTIPTGSLVLGSSLLIFLAFRQQLPVAFVAMFVAGLGLGLTYAFMPVLILGAVPIESSPSANGLNQLLRAVGNSLGSAAAATLLTGVMPREGGSPSETGFSVTLLVGAVFCVVIAAVTSVVGRGRSDVPPD